MPEFIIPDVSADQVMGVARVAATLDDQSPGTPADRGVVLRSLNVSEETARRGIIAAEQLGFLRAAGSGWIFSGSSNLRFARKDELPLFMRERLLAYPPFLIFVTQVMQGFDVEVAASFTAGVLRIDKSGALLKSLRAWGVYSGLLTLALHGGVVPAFEPIKLLDLGFVRRLATSLDQDAKVRTFVVQELGPDLVADLGRRGAGDLPVALADSLVKHESEPRRVGDPVGSLIEVYCASLLPAGVQSNSLPDIAKKLEEHGVILHSHRNLLFGLAGFRHPASHGPDPKTQERWNVTPRGSLIGQLLGLAAIRSIFLWTRAKKQEI